MRPGRCRLLLLLGAALFGCSSDPSGVQPQPLNIFPHTQRQATLGQQVTFALEVQNPSDREVVLTLPHGEFSFDPIVTSPDGEELVWRRWNGVVANMQPDAVVIPPGGAHLFSAVWHLRDLAGEEIDPGMYNVELSLVVAPFLTVLGHTRFALTVTE